MKRTSRTQRAATRWSAAALAATAAAFLACGAHDASAPEAPAPVDPIPECEQYVAAYRACFGNLGPEAHRLTDERATEIHDRYLAAARDEAARDSTRHECAANVAHLQGACR